MQNEENLKNIINTLVKQEGIQQVDLSKIGLIDPDILDLIPDEIAIKYKLIPISRNNGSISVTMANPFDILAQEAVQATTKLQPNIYFTPEEQLEEWLGKLYFNSNPSLDDIADTMQPEVEVYEEEQDDEMSIEVLKDQAQDAPAIRYVNNILQNAIQERASDIHIEPQEKELKVRLRIDGALREIASPPKKLQGGIISRIKILGSLDIAERRVPQDGRSKLKIFGRNVDIRISTLPTIYGEKVVLRVLDKESHSLNISDLGLEPNLQEKFKQTLSEPHGMILVTGPTGSGKTTTLYSALNYVNTPEKNIITIEDPVEYRLRGINQIQAKPEVGLTFAAGLRAILRQDPDIIMVGEIRDLETAEIAIRAALTGHLVLSTLHTNDSIATIMRLIDMGIDKYLLSSSILLIMAQRLVRRICFHCSDTYQLDQSMINRLKNRNYNLENLTLYRGRGCANCGDTGYWGRVAIFEFFYLNNTIRNLIMKGAGMEEIRSKAQEFDMEMLLTNGLKKAGEGITTIEEILKVASENF
ncbi:MAG: GspE/PulE family protein [bacterium]